MTFEETAEEKKFISRDVIERDILFPEGAWVNLEGNVKGAKRVECKRWSTRKAFKGGKIVSEILAALFPEDVIFLVQIDFTKPLTASAELYEIVFNRIYDPMVQLIAMTLEITQEEIRDFIDQTTPVDILNLFIAIVNQEINNSNVDAIIKKVQGLLVEKFRLDSESLSLPSILASLLQTSPTSHPTNLPSSLTTLKSIGTEID